MHCTASHLFHVYIVLSVNISIILKNVESVRIKIDSSKASGQNQPKTWQSLHSPGMPGGTACSSKAASAEPGAAAADGTRSVS